MTVEDVSNRLKELGKATAFSVSERQEIESLYSYVLGKTFVRTSCNDCYRDAVYEMYSYLKKNGKMKEKTIYRLKNGALLQMEFGSGDFYTNANLTDEAAERYLAKYPERINLFAVYPDDWQERVSGQKEADEADESEDGSRCRQKEAEESDEPKETKEEKKKRK